MAEDRGRVFHGCRRRHCSRRRQVHSRFYPRLAADGPEAQIHLRRNEVLPDVVQELGCQEEAVDQGLNQEWTARNHARRLGRHRRSLPQLRGHDP